MCEHRIQLPLQLKLFLRFRIFQVKLCRRAPAIDGLFDQREQSTHFKMLNEEGENVDLYIPRKCSWTNRLIEAKDHASVQINVGHLDQTGVFNGQYTTIALSGYVRHMVSLIARRAR